MSSVIHQSPTRLDWFEEVSQKLDMLKNEAVQFADEDDILPSCDLFERVKRCVQDLRQLTDFQMATPDVWLGPDGQIGLTWCAGTRTLELIFSETHLTSRLTVDGHQQAIKPALVPVELKQFAA